MRVFLLFLGACASALAQTSESSQAHVRWVRGASNSDSFYRNGALVEVVRNGGIEVSASLADTGTKMRAQIAIVNSSSTKLDVVPELFGLDITEPRPKRLKYETSAEIAKSIARRAGWDSFAAGMGEMSTKTVSSQSQTNGNVSVYDQSGNTSNGTYSGSTTTTTTVPDERARERSRERVAEIHERARESITRLKSITLQANTLDPGMQIAGAVFFSREKNHEAGVLTVPVGMQTFEFRFLWPKK